VAQQNQAELRRVTQRVEGLTVAQVSNRQTWPASIPTTTTERTGQPSSRPFRGRGGRRGGRPRWYGMKKTGNERSATSRGPPQSYQHHHQGQYTPAPHFQGRANNLCSRCGHSHGEQTRWALNVSSRGCGKRGHLQRCCLIAQRAPIHHLSDHFPIDGEGPKTGKHLGQE
jgi:hypothetical protein